MAVVLPHRFLSTIHYGGLKQCLEMPAGHGCAAKTDQFFRPRQLAPNAPVIM